MWAIAVVVAPEWFLVWYNSVKFIIETVEVVAPEWFLVWYNSPPQNAVFSMLDCVLRGLLFGARMEFFCEIRVFFSI